MDIAQPIELGADIRNDPVALRRLFRSGGYAGRTSGLAMGIVQANLVILPEADAADFLRYCQRNPQPCPLLAVGEPGNPGLPRLGADIDLRTDLPRYHVWRDGALADTVTDISAL